MEIPVEAWYEAIFKRQSRRTFTLRFPDDEKLARIDRVCREFRPFQEARAVFVRSSPDTVFKGFVGNYGRVKGASAYIAFIGRMESPHVQEASGYTGEGIILEATSLGLATCWVGGFFHPEAVRKQVEIQQGEKVMAVTPVGYSPEGKDLSEKILSGVVRSHSRKPLAALIDGEPFPVRLEKAFAAARLAPSAQNRQPWKFRIGKDGIIISTDTAFTTSSISKRLDCGIAMLHFELGARTAGVEGEWDLLPAPEVARFRF